MRLIDADALILKLENDIDCMDDGILIIFTQAEIKDIKNTLTVDAVEVVRCENCKHRNGDYCHRYQDGYSAFIHRDDFCNYAERRENETD